MIYYILGVYRLPEGYKQSYKIIFYLSAIKATGKLGAHPGIYFSPTLRYFHKNNARR
jgi:hypothetical protein